MRQQKYHSKRNTDIIILHEKKKIYFEFDGFSKASLRPIFPFPHLPHVQLLYKDLWQMRNKLQLNKNEVFSIIL